MPTPLSPLHDLGSFEADHETADAIVQLAQSIGGESGRRFKASSAEVSDLGEQAIGGTSGQNLSKIEANDMTRVGSCGMAMADIFDDDDDDIYVDDEDMSLAATFEDVGVLNQTTEERVYPEPARGDEGLVSVSNLDLPAAAPRSPVENLSAKADQDLGGGPVEGVPRRTDQYLVALSILGLAAKTDEAATLRPPKKTKVKVGFLSVMVFVWLLLVDSRLPNLAWRQAKGAKRSLAKLIPFMRCRM
uniref:Uncharacterized protein n=1 Tax=Arundo donax TaxID=35708 RepID=A0A0A9GIN8_ARUDO